MAWEISVSSVAEKPLVAITDRRVQRELVQAIDSLEDDPLTRGKPLSGKLADCFSIRAEAQRYRIIYKVDREAGRVFVLTIGSRKQGDRADVYALAERLIRFGLFSRLE
jgi:mRNA interferase RelE/StbE